MQRRMWGALLVFFGVGAITVAGAPTTIRSPLPATGPIANDPEARSRMDDAIVAGDVEQVTRSLDRITDINDYFLQRAVNADRFEIAKLLLDRGANPNGPAGSCAPLFWAAADGRLSIATLLLDHGASTEPASGPNPLRAAISRRHKGVIQLLLGRGANVNVQQSDGNTPLHQAVKHCDVELVKLLIAAGADPDLKNKQGRSPLEMSTLDLAKVIREAATTRPTTTRPSTQP